MPTQLNEIDVERMRDLFRCGVRLRPIARQFSVPQRRVWRIVRGYC